MTALSGIEPDPVALRGGVLRAWREYAGMSGAELGRALPAQRSTVSMWEADGRAKRAATAQIVWDIARCLGLDAVQAVTLTDLWRAASSVSDGLSRRVWSHNFGGPSGPGWVWLRAARTGSPDASRIAAELWWGEPFQASIDLRGPQGGVVVTLPTTLRNPALEVRLDSPGWADFGRGSIPLGVTDRLGIRVIDGASLLEPAPSTSRRPTGTAAAVPSGYAGMLRRIFEDIGIGWRVLRPHLDVAPAIECASAQIEAPGGSCAPTWSDDTPARLSIPADQVGRVRQARGRSRQSVADQVSTLDRANPVSARAIEILEATGRVAPITGLLGRIDLVLALDGRLGVECTFDSREASVGSASRQYLLSFPQYWVGPVWLRAGGPADGATGTVDLRWGPWRRRQSVRSGAVLDFRRAPSATAPLRAIVPAGWQVTAGIGAWPGALDINRDWWPADLSATIGLLRTALTDIRVGHGQGSSPRHV